MPLSRHHAKFILIDTVYCLLSWTQNLIVLTQLWQGKTSKETSSSSSHKSNLDNVCTICDFIATLSMYKSQWPTSVIHIQVRSYSFNVPATVLPNQSMQSIWKYAVQAQPTRVCFFNGHEHLWLNCPLDSPLANGMINRWVNFRYHCTW